MGRVWFNCYRVFIRFGFIFSNPGQTWGGFDYWHARPTSSLLYLKNIFYYFILYFNIYNNYYYNIFLINNLYKFIIFLFFYEIYYFNIIKINVNGAGLKIFSSPPNCPAPFNFLNKTHLGIEKIKWDWVEIGPPLPEPTPLPSLSKHHQLYIVTNV